ncbi:MAG TPA: SIR2 family protein [Clostridiaceae bacterium]
MYLDNILMVGNGINRIDNNNSWEDILKDLIKFIDKSDTLLLKDKPFSLLYEEIVVRGKLYRGKREEEVKKYIANLTSMLIPNNVHKKIMKLGFEHILTTNYDYTLESALSQELVNTSDISEIRYSLYRKNKAGSSYVWHVHGEEKTINSILLGYEHYAAYIQKMRNYVKGNEKNTTVDNTMTVNTLKVASWIDLFFTKNIYIMGLSLDYIEIDLWWLLTYRAREKHLGRYPLNADNEIIYICTKSEYIAKPSKMQVLESMGITIKIFDLKGNDWGKFYLEALDYIEGSQLVRQAI